jgi:hypothetical protein
VGHHSLHMQDRTLLLGRSDIYQHTFFNMGLRNTLIVYNKTHKYDPLNNNQEFTGKSIHISWLNYQRLDNPLKDIN